MRILVLLLAFQDAEPATQPSPQSRLAQGIANLGRAMEQIEGWDEHYGYLMDALETIYERNDWTSESDRFSLEAIAEIESAPPWAFQERFDRFVEVISDRYLLDEQQERLLRSQVARRSNAIFLAHQDRILQYAGEAVATRVGRRPFTGEQIARWAELAAPVMDDVQRHMTEFSRDFLPRLDDEQRALAERDLQAAERRLGRVAELRREWAEGKWKPEDWGLENDPIQTGIAPDGPRTPAAGSARTDEPSDWPANQAARLHPPGTAPAETANDPWAEYVRAYIQRYRLDADQQQQAWSIHRQVTERRTSLERRRATPGNGAASTQPAAREAAAVDRLFEQLRRRLERLPTRAQRRAAEPASERRGAP